MKQIVFFVLLISMVACQSKKASLPYFNTPDFTPEWLTSSAAAKTNLHTVPPFHFTDQSGSIVSEKTVAGKIYVVDFFFTRCIGICPKMTSNMSKVAAAFQKDNDVLILSHSVTPEADSVAVLQQYATLNKITNPNWHLLTGNKEAIYSIARNGYFIEKSAGYSKDTTEFLHTENFVLIDKQSHIRGIYNGTIEFEMEQLIKHIKILQQEGD